jgi:hypothetical protein
MKRFTTKGGKLIRAAQAVAQPNSKISSEHYGAIRKLHRAGKSPEEIVDHLKLDITPEGLKVHARKNMELNLGKNNPLHNRVHHVARPTAEELEENHNPKGFKQFLQNKFAWQPDDVEHHRDETPKPVNTDKFTWQDGDVEHHHVDESLDEKFHIGPEVKGHHLNPVKHSNHDWKTHPVKTDTSPHRDSEAHHGFVAHNDSLDDDDKYSIDHYKSSGYSTINSHLRDEAKSNKKVRQQHMKKLSYDSKHLKYKDDEHADLKGPKKPKEKHVDPWHNADRHEQIRKNTERHIKRLDKITDHRTDEHHTVYRSGIPGDKRKFPVGHKFTDHGYMSTSFRKDVAGGASFAHSHPTKNFDQKYGDKAHKKHIHVIHVPKGTRAHYLDVHGDDSEHGNAHEKELLLNRGTKLKVTHHSEDDGAHYIHSRVVKQGVRSKLNLTSKQIGKPKDSHGLPGQHKFPFMKHHDRFKK